MKKEREREKKIPTPSRFSFRCRTFDRPRSSSRVDFHLRPSVHSDVRRFVLGFGSLHVFGRIEEEEEEEERMNEFYAPFFFIPTERRRIGLRFFFFCFSLPQLVFAPFHLRLSHVHTDEIWDEIFNWKQEMVMRSFPDERRSKLGKIFFHRWAEWRKVFQRDICAPFASDFPKISRICSIGFASTLSQYFLLKMTDENRTKEKKKRWDIVEIRMWYICLVSFFFLLLLPLFGEHPPCVSRYWLFVPRQIKASHSSLSFLLRFFFFFHSSLLLLSNLRLLNWIRFLSRNLSFESHFTPRTSKGIFYFSLLGRHLLCLSVEKQLQFELFAQQLTEKKWERKFIC